MITAEDVQDEIIGLLKSLAAPVVAGESVKACIGRAARRGGLTFTQAKRAWYREWRNIPAHVADSIREKATAHDRQLKHAAFRTLVELQDSDPEFFRDCVEALGEILLPERSERGSPGKDD